MNRAKLDEEWPNEWTSEMSNKARALPLRMDGIPAGLGYCQVMLELERVTNSVLTSGLV